jgi:hypothetical protein
MNKPGSGQIYARDIFESKTVKGQFADGYWYTESIQPEPIQSEPIQSEPIQEDYYLLPGGLVDAHAHLSLDFSRTGLAKGSEALIKLNQDKQLQSGVLALRDAGQVPETLIPDSSLSKHSY